MNTPFWLNDPTILLSQDSITKIWPSKTMDPNEKINAITRLVIIMTLLGFLITKNMRVVVTGVATLIALVVLYFAQKNAGESETVEPYEGFNTMNKEQLNGSDFTRPTVSNPVMNVLMTDYQDNPNRPKAAPSYNPIIKDEINKATEDFVVNQFDDKTGIKDRLFKDLGDQFDLDMSMRQWYPTANTNIPNDQKAFAEFCYGDMKSCKEGHEESCIKTMPHRHINL